MMNHLLVAHGSIEDALKFLLARGGDSYNRRRGHDLSYAFLLSDIFAEFAFDLSRMRPREGMAIARYKGKLQGQQPKLSDRQQRELCRMHATAEYSIGEIAELFSVSKATVYRTLKPRVCP